MRPIRIGLLGFGWVNRVLWLPRISAHRCFELAAVFDPRLTDTSVPRCASLSDFLCRDLDLVVVGTPNHAHATLGCSVLDHGIPVFIEKPLCLSADELDRLEAAAHRSGAGILVSRASLQRTDVRALAELMPEGPKVVHATWLRSDGVPRPGSWFTRRAHAGGGALLDLGWHVADVALRLLAYPQIESLAARLTHDPSGMSLPGAGWRGDADIGDSLGRDPDVEIDGSLEASFADGSRLTVRAAWVSEVSVDTTRIVVDAGAERMELLTTFGLSPCRIRRPTLVVQRRGVTEHVMLAKSEPGREYGEQLEIMSAFVAGALDWRAELRECRAVLELLSGAYACAGHPLIAAEGPRAIDVPDDARVERGAA